MILLRIVSHKYLRQGKLFIYIVSLSLVFGINFISQRLLAKENLYIKDRISIDIGYSRISSTLEFAFGKDHYLQISGSYGINNWMQVGAYFGDGPIVTYYKDIDLADVRNNLAANRYSSKTHNLFYGLHADIHLLPFIVKASDFRFDLYIPSKIGGSFIMSKEFFLPERGHRTEYGIGIGTAFYPGKHWGVFGEYCIGNYFLNDNKRWLVGLTFKF